jgi:hypothetical protein
MISWVSRSYILVVLSFSRLCILSRFMVMADQAAADVVDDDDVSL